MYSLEDKENFRRLCHKKVRGGGVVVAVRRRRRRRRRKRRLRAY
jgi:hypothetical protein